MKSVAVKNILLGLVLLMFAAFVAACSGGSDNEPDCDADSLQNCVATPTRTPAATQTPTSTATPTPTATPPATATPTATPTPPPAACSGQGLIAIDPVHNVAYVPTGTVDTSGNATVALVDITPGAKTPLLKTLSMVGSSSVRAAVFNPNSNTVLAEGFGSAGTVLIYEIDTATQAVKGTPVRATGLTNLGAFGGIVENASTNHAFVADETNLGVLDTSKSPPVWNATSVVSTVGSDSLALNFVTGILFMSRDGSNQIIDTTKSPLVPTEFQRTAIADGVSFDVATNIAILSAEVGLDESFAFNFATLDTTVSPATADTVTVPGAGCKDTTCNGETGTTGSPLVGEGPGGQAAINCATHQAVIVDEAGQNLKLIQLPVAPVTGALNNNGQPGSGTKPDAASVFTISGTVLPLVTGTPLLADGDPNSLSVYPAQNFAYMRATGPGGKFLAGVDLSKPILGASGALCVAHPGNPKDCWNPVTVAIPLQ